MPIPAGTNSRIEAHYITNGVKCLSKLYYRNDEDMTDQEVGNLLTGMAAGFFSDLFTHLSEDCVLNELRLVPMESPMLYDYSLVDERIGTVAAETVCPFTVMNLGMAGQDVNTGRAIYNHMKQSGLPRTQTKNGVISATAQVNFNNVLAGLIGLQTIGGMPGRWMVRTQGAAPPGTIAYAPVAQVSTKAIIYTLDRRKV